MILFDHSFSDDDGWLIGLFDTCPLLRVGGVCCLCRMFAQKGDTKRGSEKGPEMFLLGVCFMFILEDVSCKCELNN